MKRLLAVALLLASPAAARDPEEPGEIIPLRRIPSGAGEPSAETPRWLRWMLSPRTRGMLVRLPIIDTDPNRGITAGVMPIWVIQGRKDERIEHIHAPSLTRNQHFGFIPTYRYYYYPASDAALVARASYAESHERELFAHYEDGSLYGHDVDISVMGQYNTDGAKRFYGFGPDAPRSAEQNYMEDLLKARVAAGTSIAPGSRWRVHLADQLLSQRTPNGLLSGFPEFDKSFPGVAAPRRRRQTNELRVALDYDTRDHAVTTSRGSYVVAFAEASVRGLASSDSYRRYGFDARRFQRWPRKGHVTAASLRCEQLYGDAPFWLLPSLGGKYSLRAYGSGRYIDKGSAVANIEQRWTFYEEKMAGVTTEFELAPFAGVGTVFNAPGRLAGRYLRPVVGAAVRAVARPQVVGSIDFGAGREGLTVFMDINYSF